MMLYKQVSKGTFFSPENKRLNWKDRPESVREAIHKNWQRVNDRRPAFDDNDNTFKLWNWNGTYSTYDIFSLSEYALIRDIILKNPERKDFYFLDIGAGEFEVIRSLGIYLNSDSALPQDIVVHLIGLRGEDWQEKSFLKAGITNQYFLGHAQIENLLEVLTEAGQQHPTLPNDLSKKIDLVISAMTFVHFVDPLGTLQQAYSLLRPNGYLISDGFYCPFPGDRVPGIAKFATESPMAIHTSNRFDWSYNLYTCLFSSQVPFLCNFNRRPSSLSQFILKGVENKEFTVPLKYNEAVLNSEYFYEHRGQHFPMAGFTPTETDEIIQISAVNVHRFDELNHMTGDADLFIELFPLFKKDIFTQRYMPPQALFDLTNQPDEVIEWKDEYNSPWKSLRIKLTEEQKIKFLHRFKDAHPDFMKAYHEMEQNTSNTNASTRSP